MRSLWESDRTGSAERSVSGFEQIGARFDADEFGGITEVIKERRDFVPHFDREP